MKENLPTTTTSSCEVANGGQSCATRNRTVRPRYKAARRESGVELRVFIPGTDKSTVNVSVDEGVLTVKASRNDSMQEGWRPLITEIERLDYRLKLELSSEFDPEKISAKVEKGLLLLALPYAETAKPRDIAVD
ncbi:MAG: Hsp20/alpha crystallin family protein [Verrucomicrobiota bacterium]